MSIAWMTRVFASPKPTQATERLMLLALADNANDQGVCWPSMNTLRSKCALKTIRGAEKVVARLEGGGFVERELRDGKTTLYHLQGRSLGWDGAPTPERADGGEAARPPNTRTGVEEAPPEPSDGGPPNDGTGEPSKNHHKERQQAMRAQARRTGPDDQPTAESLPAAASLEDRSSLLEELVARGVAEPVAASLVAESEPEHVQAMLERGAEEAKGPGWYVRAIREGYHSARTGASSEESKQPRLRWDQVRRRMAERGLEVSTWGDHFKIVTHDEKEEPLFVELEEAAESMGVAEG